MDRDKIDVEPSLIQIFGSIKVAGFEWAAFSFFQAYFDLATVWLQ